MNAIQQAIALALDGKELDYNQAFATMEMIMRGEATDAQIGAFLIALRMKGETAGEIAGLAASMRGNARTVAVPAGVQAIDIVGTGGDGKHTFNISTVAAFVIAGAGVPVAKHGNRSVSSKCGSADVLEALGVRTDLDAAEMAICLREAGLAFLFAPALHPAMKHAIGPRREIGVRSVFNILGPITNPAGVLHQVVGVYERRLVRLLAEVLQKLGSGHVMVVHSADGLDEISLADVTYVAELKDGSITEYEVSPAEFGLQNSDVAIGGGDAATNAGIARAVLAGESGPERDIVIANAAAGLYVAGRAHNLREAAALAAESIDSGQAKDCLQKLIDVTGNLKDGKKHGA